jgi:hypothetical protein
MDKVKQSSLPKVKLITQLGCQDEVYVLTSYMSASQPRRFKWGELYSLQRIGQK